MIFPFPINKDNRACSTANPDLKTVTLGKCIQEHWFDARSIKLAVFAIELMQLSHNLPPS